MKIEIGDREGLHRILVVQRDPNESLGYSFRGSARDISEADIVVTSDGAIIKSRRLPVLSPQGVVS